MIAKKGIPFFAVLFAFAVLTFPAECFADTASDMGQIESYVKNGMFIQAEQLCNSIAQKNPGSDSALKARGKLAAVYIMTQRMAQADAEVVKLMKDYKSNAELPAILYGVAGRYKTVKESQRAENLCQRICQDYPSSQQAQRIPLDSGKERVFGLIADGQYQQAEEVVNGMVAKAGSNPSMPATLFKIAREFKECGRFDEAMRVSQKIVQNYPTSEFGGKAKMGADKLNIWSLIKAGDVAGAQTALEKLITDYKNEGDLPHTVHGVALRFEENGYFAQAKTLYQRVKKDYADSDVAAIVAMDLKKCDIREMVGRSSFSEIAQQLNTLLVSFKGHEHLPLVVWQIGDEYYKQAERLEGKGSVEQAKGLYRNAAGVWDILINRLPASVATADACNYTAVCYEKLGDYAKANDCYQKVLDGYPGYKKRWKAMFMIGHNYEQMKNTGKVSVAQADEKIKAIYGRLLTEYPDCRAADYVRKFLGR